MSFTYELSGLPESVVRTSSNFPTFSLNTEFIYDDAGRLKNLNYRRNGGTTAFATFGYELDGASRIAEITTERIFSNVRYQQSQILTYDTEGSGQLKSVTTSLIDNNLADPYTPADIEKSFFYDDNGNQTPSGIANPVGSNNRLATDGTFNYFYDREGNIIRKTNISTHATTEYVWDYRNRLAEVREYGSKAIDFSTASLVSYSNYNSPTNILDDGATLQLSATASTPAARALNLGSYTITPSTILEFDFHASEEGTLGGFRFTTALPGIPERFFQIYGTATSNTYIVYHVGLKEYIQSDGTGHFRLNIASYLRGLPLGTHQYLEFLSTGGGKIEFSNVRLYESTNLSAGLLQRTSYEYSADDLIVRK